MKKVDSALEANNNEWHQLFKLQKIKSKGTLTTNPQITPHRAYLQK